MKRIRVLFLCSDNGVYGPMAEGLLRRVDSEHFVAMSAGIKCGETHALAAKAMSEIGIDLERRVLKGIDDVSGLHFDFVITLCERARAECPEFPGAEIAHWRLDNPMATSDHTKRERMFQSLRDQIAQRIRLFALVQVRFTAVAATAHRHSHLHTDLVHL